MTTRRVINLFLVFAAIIVAGLVISWRLSENKETMKENAELTQVRNTTVAVAIDTVTTETFSSDFEVNGTFEPSQEVMVISDVNGRITSLKIDEGSYVKRGQLILTVDNQLLNNQLKSLQLNLDKSRRDLARMQNLLADGGVTQTQFEEAKLGSESLEIQIASLQKQIADTYMKSPISGVVSNMMVENGSYLAPGAQVANIVNTNPIRLKVFLTEEQVVTVKSGQKVAITADVLAGKTFNGTVTFVDVKADNTKRFPVEIQIPNSNAIKAGMNGEATFNAGKPVNVLAAPREAFVGTVQDGQVFVLDGNKARLRKVTPGDIYGNQVVIRSGLAAGERVITSGQINLQDNTEVSVIK
jgi:RND family efflux transporter MFP subunit